MLKQGRHVLKEIVEGLKDNVNAIRLTLFHPLYTFFSLLDALLHPIRTVQETFAFAWHSPIRFLTNLGLSFLEGRLFSMSVQGVSKTTTALISPLQAQNTTHNIGLSSWVTTSPTVVYCPQAAKAAAQCPCLSATSSLSFSSGSATTAALLEVDGANPRPG